MTMRLSASSLAGTARTLVAVGTVSETFMFLTTAAAAPRSGLCLPAATGVAGFGGGRGAAWLGGLGGRRAALGGSAAGSARRPARPAGCGRRGGRGLGGAPASRPAAAPWPAAAGAVGRRGAARCAVAAADRAARPVVGEELVPGLVHAGRVGEVLLVHLLDQPLVGAESRHRRTEDAEEGRDELTLDTGSSAFFVCGRALPGAVVLRLGRCGMARTGCRVYAASPCRDLAAPGCRRWRRGTSRGRSSRWRRGRRAARPGRRCPWRGPRRRAGAGRPRRG